MVPTYWQELADHTDEVSVQHEVLDGMFTFYDAIRARLNIYQVFLSLIAVCSYVIEHATLNINSEKLCISILAEQWIIRMCSVYTLRRINCNR